MGADLILAIAPMPKGADGPNAINDWKSAYLHAIAKLTDEQALDIYEEVFGDVPDESFDDNPPRTQRWLPAEIARKTFREFVSVIDEDRRDCGLYQVGDRWALISGGMSWGDSPTDSWTEVQCLANIWWVVNKE
jgi:hypothetical protein